MRRRVYRVPGPNAVWHVDGNHKLIRWHLVIHGAIDGYSRTITFLKCSSNNTASTVLTYFQTAVEAHGLPTRIRTDLGGENIDVWHYMVEQHETHECVLVGASVHNERIERLWRDVFRCVLSVFHETFQKMERDEILDCLNDVDIFCLHHIFLPRISGALKDFTESWNNHPISTEHNLTPNQLYVQGFMQQRSTPLLPLTTTSNRPTGRLPFQPGDAMCVPRSTFSPCRILQRELSTIDPMATTFDFGYSLYVQAIQVVGQHIQNGCTTCST